jgi:hypothetical protein
LNAINGELYKGVMQVSSYQSNIIMPQSAVETNILKNEGKASQRRDKEIKNLSVGMDLRYLEAATKVDKYKQKLFINTSSFEVKYYENLNKC